MADAKICDIKTCGKVLTPEHTHQAVWASREYDVCPDCWESIQNWMTTFLENGRPVAIKPPSSGTPYVWIQSDPGTITTGDGTAAYPLPSGNLWTTNVTQTAPYYHTAFTGGDITISGLEYSSLGLSPTEVIPDESDETSSD
jgi:hypothetical protein